VVGRGWQTTGRYCRERQLGPVGGPVAKRRGKNAHDAVGSMALLVLLGVPVALAVWLLTALARNPVLLVLMLVGGVGLIFWRSKVRGDERWRRLEGPRRREAEIYAARVAAIESYHAMTARRCVSVPLDRLLFRGRGLRVRVIRPKRGWLLSYVDGRGCLSTMLSSLPQPARAACQRRDLGAEFRQQACPVGVLGGDWLGRAYSHAC
jgi:hypothetical protein